MKNGAELIDAKMVQRLIAVLAFSLPLILVLGQWYSGVQPRFYSTISEYVHGPVGNIFVGVIYALGALFFTYKGYPINKNSIFKIPDNWLANATGFFLVLVATFETLLCNTSSSCGIVTPSVTAQSISAIHKMSAVLAFTSLGIFCLCYFTQEGQKDNYCITKRRVRIYKICGWTIFGAMFIASIIMYLKKDECATSIGTAYIMWLEWIMIWAFAFAWCVKGRMILKSEPNDCGETAS